MGIPVVPGRGVEIAIIGGGPAGLMAAHVLATALPAGDLAITVYDRMPSVGRKLLLAGRGGLNLTHSEPREDFLARYGTASAALAPMLDAWSPTRLRAWAEGLGQQTFVGSSGRVFPRPMKASPLLRAWLGRLDGLGVRVATRHRWRGWDDDGDLRFAVGNDGRETTVRPRATLLALGGASWPRLGSDGAWAPLLADVGVVVTPLAPANSGCEIAWSDVFRERFAGEPLKRIALTVGETRVRGEAMVTRTGLEGGAVYALSARLRAGLAGGEAVELGLDLRPDLTAARIAERLGRARGGASLANHLRKTIALPPVAIGLLREVAGADFGRLDATALAATIKDVRLAVTGLRPLDRAISTAGGVALDAVDQRLMLSARPGVFVAGEMLDWEAPTGGYLLQACCATGVAAARGMLGWLGTSVAQAEPGEW